MHDACIRHDLALGGYPQSLIITAIKIRRKGCRPDINGTHLGTAVILFVKAQSECSFQNRIYSSYVAFLLLKTVTLDSTVFLVVNSCSLERGTCLRWFLASTLKM